MTNQGQKALSGQVQNLRNSLAQVNGRNFRLNNEIRVLQSNQFAMLEPSFFRAFLTWFRKWRNFRTESMVEYDGKKWPKGSKLASDESGNLFIAPPGTPKEEIVATL